MHGIERAVKVLVVFVFQCAGGLRPQRFHIVNDVVFFRVHLFSILPFGLFAEGDGDGQELAILVEQLLYARFVQELFAIVVDIQHDVGAAVVFLHLFYFVSGRPIATPLHGLRTFLIAARDDFHLLAHHKGRVETQTEVPDNGVGVVFVLVEEVGYARKSDLVDVSVNLVGGHSHTSVANG